MNTDYERIAAAIRYIENHLADQPSLADIAAAAGLSPFHFQRLFRRWTGVSPKRFLAFLTVEYAKRLLEQSRSVMDAAFASGLSGPARLHDHFVSLEAVSPGEYKRRGRGLDIRYGVHSSPFGPVLLAITGRGLCALSFLAKPADAADELSRLRDFWSGAEFSADAEATNKVAQRIFAPGAEKLGNEPLHLLVKGTNFQVKVWRALLQIPSGRLCSYEQIARALGKPGAGRAVGQAVAANPIGFLIPCHRVIRSIGLIGGYRWDPVRKRALIAWEAARAQAVSDARPLSFIRSG